MRTALYEHGIGREFISVLYLYCLSCRLHETTTYNKMRRILEEDGSCWGAGLGEGTGKT